MNEPAPRRNASADGRKLYDKDVLRALETVWVICDGICGKRLAPYMKWIAGKLERTGKLHLDPETRCKLLSVSTATIDRMLAPSRKRYQLRARSQTKPGTLLKHQIPIRTFADRDDLRPGFLEIDLVSHEGGDARGEYAYTLDATDVCTRMDGDRGGEKSPAALQVVQLLTRSTMRASKTSCTINSGASCFPSSRSISKLIWSTILMRQRAARDIAACSDRNHQLSRAGLLYRPVGRVV